MHWDICTYIYIYICIYTYIYKAQLKSQGPAGFTSLQRIFQAYDIDKNQTLSRVEFKIALQSMNLGIKEYEIRKIFEFFDSDENETISYDEFIRGLRDPLNSSRLNVVQSAFRSLDTKGYICINICICIYIYNICIYMYIYIYRNIYIYVIIQIHK
jgi:hypothetical protein